MTVIFKNELGNLIHLKASMEAGQVTVTMQGPSSETEWVMTKGEAKRLKMILDMLLKL